MIAKYHPLISSLSRAIGNDLVKYSELHEDGCELKLWPPIDNLVKKSIVSLIKYYHPDCSVRVYKKKGLIQIVPRRR